VAWFASYRDRKLKYRNLRRRWYAPGYFPGTYLWKGVFLDGGPGLGYAIFKFTYFFEIRGKILEAPAVQSQRPEAGAVPSIL
jgi:hypothetical protein